MPRAVKFDSYGGIDVMRVVEVDRPVPGPKQVLIRMKAAGINLERPRSARVPSPSSGPRHSPRDRAATLPASLRQSEARSGTSDAHARSRAERAFTEMVRLGQPENQINALRFTSPTVWT
jgi:hypothetical protein